MELILPAVYGNIDDGLKSQLCSGTAPATPK